MAQNLSHRKAIIDDLQIIIDLLLEEELGQTRELKTNILDPRYFAAFKAIDADPNQYLMIVEEGKEVLGTCHLNIMPSLTFTGSSRMQIEAVRIAAKSRGQKIGEWMIAAAKDYAVTRGATLIQLTTDKKRSRAKKFYEKLGFEATHEGMKLYLNS